MEAAKDADYLIFVVPHQFVRGLCTTLLGKIKPTAIALSLIKGFDIAEGGGIDLISHIISRHLKVHIYWLRECGRIQIMSAFIINIFIDSMCRIDGCKFGQ